jgi:hypothetical protein
MSRVRSHRASQNHPGQLQKPEQLGQPSVRLSPPDPATFPPDAEVLLDQALSSSAAAVRRQE